MPQNNMSHDLYRKSNGTTPLYASMTESLFEPLFYQGKQVPDEELPEGIANKMDISN